MKQSNLLYTALILIFTLCFSQSSFSQYQERSYNLKCEFTSGDDFGRSIINRLDGGYAIGGFSYAGCGIGPFDWMLLRVKPSGNHESVRLIGTLSDDKCYSLIQSTSDTGYVLAGHMFDIANSKKRATIVKMDKSSNLSYSRRLNDSLNSQYNQITNDPANTWGLTGFDERNISAQKRNKLLVTQYASTGSMNWGYRYDSYVTAASISKSTEEGISICHQSNGGVYGVAARTNYYSGNTNVWDIMIVKLSYSGAVIWKKVYRFPLSPFQNYPSTEPTKIIPMADGGFAVVGFTNRYVQSESDIIVLRVNANGGLMWSNCYGNTTHIEKGNSIVTDGDHLVITGLRNPVGQATNAFLMKIPQTGGAALWTRIWDVPNPEPEAGYDLVKSKVGAPDGYAITGETVRGSNGVDAFLWRPNVNGVIPGLMCQDSANLVCIKNSHQLDSFLLNRVAVPDAAFSPSVATPPVFTNTICLPGDSPTGTDEMDKEEVREYSLKQNYPNPFNPVTKINYEIPASGSVSIKIYDVNGRLIQTLVDEFKNTGSYDVVFNGSTFSTGVYYYKLVSENFTDIKKMILIK